MRIATITRQTIRKVIPVARIHDTPPSPTRIAQAKAERSLLDLVAACNVPGVDIEAIVNNIASRSARLDERGSRNIGDEIDTIGSVLESIVNRTDRFNTHYITAKYTLEENDAAAGASSEIVPRPWNCAALPPAVIEQIERSVNRDALRSGFAAQSIRGSADLHEVGEKADRLMREHDANSLPLVRTGNGDYALDTMA